MLNILNITGNTSKIDKKKHINLNESCNMYACYNHRKRHRKDFCKYLKFLAKTGGTGKKAYFLYRRKNIYI